MTDDELSEKYIAAQDAIRAIHNLWIEARLALEAIQEELDRHEYCYDPFEESNPPCTLREDLIPIVAKALKP